MFSAIANRYDPLNHALSLNIDRRWRAFAAQAVCPPPGAPILDCCTGTADLAIALDRQSRGANPIFGVDFTPELLRIGQAKVRKLSAQGRIRLAQGDAMRLPFSNDVFETVTVAFGLRNVADTIQGLDELIRVARPGGKVAILEFSKPTAPILRQFYWLFFQRILPKIGQTVAPNAHSAYEYLPQSVAEFPDGQAMLDLMAKRGLTDLQRFPLTAGIASLYVGTKLRTAAEV